MKIRSFFKSKRTIFGVQISDWLIVAIALMLFAGLTFWTITKSSIWFDEAFGAYLIRFNFFDIAKYTALDVHPPLFYWILKLWSMLFGNSELALRSMSVLFGGISIVIGYLLTNKLFGKTAARFSLIFMALSPMLIRYGQEARMYTIVTTISLAATYVLTVAMSSKKRLPWVIYGILIGLGMWVHYFTAIVWIAHWVWRADVIRRLSKKGRFIKEFFTKQWVGAHIVAIGLFLPWLPFLFIQIFTIQAYGYWIPPVTPDSIPSFLTNVFYYQDIGKVTSWLALIFLAAIIILAVLAFRVYKRLNNSERQSYRLILSIAFVPMIALFIASMPPLHSTFVDRYLMTSVIGISIFIGTTLTYCAKFLRPKPRIVLMILLAGMMIVGIANVYQLGNFNKYSNASNNTRQIIESVTKNSGDNQPIIAATPWLFYEAVFYATNNHPVYFLDASEYKFGSLVMLKENDQFKIKNIDDFTDNHPIFWYVLYSNTGAYSAPYSNWEAISEVTVNDSVSGIPAYRAIQYRIKSI